MVVIALLERLAGVTRSAREALRPRGGKGNHPADVVAVLVLVEPALRHVPSEVAPERRVEQHDRNAAKLVAVLVHPGNEHLDDLLDGRGNDSGADGGQPGG